MFFVLVSKYDVMVAMSSLREDVSRRESSSLSTCIIKYYIVVYKLNYLKMEIFFIFNIMTWIKDKLM